MLLGGLWHGAAWTFVAWGGLHGLYLAGERLVRNVVPPSSFWQSTIFKVSAAIATYALICITWVFFRAHSFGKAFDFLTSMFGHYSPDQVSILDPATRMRIAMFVVAILAVHWLMRDCQFVEVVARTPWWIRSVALTAMLIAVLTIQGENHAFIYFQF
jgi:alginate O-acetyltransferase complex protein AlgI